MIDDENTKPSLLIFYDYFYPGYKAGGPVQSISNLIIILQKKYTVSVITSAFDLHSDKSYPGIKVNEWNTIVLPGGSEPITVWYGNRNLTPTVISQLISQIKPQFFYLNGMFSYRFFVAPLVAIKQLNYVSKVVVCPRGMLQQGALAGSSFKKKIYLKFLKASGLLKRIHWHATTKEEKEDIIKVFGNKQHVQIAGNIPRLPLDKINYTTKQKGSLRLVYLSLIAEKKNLLLVLEMMLRMPKVTLDIYGPVKDTTYWKKCRKIIDQHPGKLKYRDEVIPAKVQETFEQYDASILLTKGENFGHALYESLSAGRPVITSYFTPWANLQQQKAGWNINISTIDEGVFLLNDICKMSPGEFNEYCIGAHNLGTKYYAGLNPVEEYEKIFSR